MITDHEDKPPETPGQPNGPPRQIEDPSDKPGTPPRRPLQHYRVLIDRDPVEVSTSPVTGRELLELAGKRPVDNYAIYLKVKGSQPVRIALDEKIDLGRPGVERFVTLPLDQTEGFGARRDFTLPQEDLEWLDQAAGRFELVAEHGVLRVVLYDFPIPLGYQCRCADVNVRIETGYPDTGIDMVYVHPALQRVDGQPIGAISTDDFDGRQWQRWSRHRTPANPWRPGIDNLATHFGLVEHWFARELG